MTSLSSSGNTPPETGDHLALYDYELPPENIAQSPPARRGESRLLALERTTGRRQHLQFADIVTRLRPGDLLVLNESRVFPARLRARRATGGRVELLLLESLGDSGAWSTLARPAKNLRPGETLGLGEEPHYRVRVLGRDAERVVVELLEDGRVLDRGAGLDLCERVGETPLPPYIRRGAAPGAEDRERYQTVYARERGSAAAPTAGLHFTPELLARLETQGIRVARITLHVGLGTFQPLQPETLSGDRLHGELVEIAAEEGRKLTEARAAGRRIVAVGTTSARALESFFRAPRLPFRERTELFIKPGHTFLGVDALITNFHLPRSSLLVLVSAFAGRDLVLGAYREAVTEGYRFYSYGDAMFIE